MKKLILAVFSVTVPILSAIGQDLPEEDKPKLILSPGISYQGQLFGEINLMYSKLAVEHGGNAIWDKSPEVTRHRITLTANVHRELWHAL